MKILRWSDDDFADALQGIERRSAFSPEIETGVAGILADIRREGDVAISRYAEKFDGVRLAPEQFRLSVEEWDQAIENVEDSLKQAIDAAHRNLLFFARKCCPEAWDFSPRPGVTLGEKFIPYERIAAYVPGGAAPLVSTVLHTVTMAAAAGVKEIVVTTPPGKNGEINSALLYAAKTAGATEVYRLGGVYAVGALAYGTQQIRPVQKIVGPGNAYVTEAKRQVYGRVSLDLVAGPSEILVIADASADPRYVAADMLSQAEHGTGREGATLVTTSETVLQEVAERLREGAAAYTENPGLHQVLAAGVFLILARDLEQAAEIANRYAPEHLEVLTETPRDVAANLTAAGAIFLGPWTPEPVGDFVAGPSHVLPTGGAARLFSGLTVSQFFRRTSVVEYERSALVAEREMIAAFAQAEQLPAHGFSAEVRFR